MVPDRPPMCFAMCNNLSPFIVYDYLTVGDAARRVSRRDHLRNDGFKGALKLLEGLTAAIRGGRDEGST